jgi:protein SCO1/2
MTPATTALTTPTTEDELDATVAAIRADPARRDTLVDLLAESAPIYEGRGMATTARLRGWVLAAFEDVGLPDAAVPVVLEELESGIEPHLVAAAAKAARGGARDPDLGPCLLNAFENLRTSDDTVTFESLRPSWPPANPTTALLEILATVRWLGAVGPVTVAVWRAREVEFCGRLSPTVAASLAETVRSLEDAGAAPGCCHEPVSPAPGDGRAATGEWASVEVEDQMGARHALDDLLHARPTVVAFFYTRCPNPNKCSLTVLQLAEVQRHLVTRSLHEEVGILALTYDPGYDTADRLHRYGLDRGIAFSPTARLARAVTGHDDLRTTFGLQVGYRDTVVNRHAIELFLVAADGTVADSWTRRRWDPAEVVDRAGALVRHGAR